MSTTTECEFFMSEAEATKIVSENMKDILNRINASSSLTANFSQSNATNIGSGGNSPCNGSPDDGSGGGSCQCCLC